LVIFREWKWKAQLLARLPGHKILIDKPMKCGLDEQTGNWIENWMNRRAQRLVISGAKSSWKPVSSVVT